VSLSEALARASNKPAGKRPYFLEDREVERVLAITMAVAQELAVARERIDTLERLLEAKGVVARDEIERFHPTADQAAERGLWMQEYLTRVLRIVQQEAEAIDANAAGDLYSEEVAVEVSRVEA
jgi:hypothetical protein